QSSTAALTAPESVMLHSRTTQVPPSFSMIARVSSAAAKLISVPYTCAPWRANRTAVALPLPQPGPTVPAPDMNATLPFRSSIEDAATNDCRYFLSAGGLGGASSG